MAQVKIIAPQTREAEHLRVAAYCRVSSDSRDQLHSYAAQIRSYTEEIARHDGWELVDVYADEGLTGTRMDQRDDFNRMMRDCRKGKIDRILVKSVSRFARNTRDCLSALRELSAMGVSVRFEKENIDTKTLTTELMVSVSGSLAQQESISISANQKMSYQRRMERGEFITCTAPYGYRIVNKKYLEIVPEEAATVRWIFDAYLKGRSSGWIAEQLTAKGVPSQSGAECWRETGIRYLLTNEKYIGDALSQKSYSCGFPFVQKRNHGERLQYYTENSHPAIIELRPTASVAGLLVTGGPYLLAALLTHGKALAIGGGDIKLMGACGFVLGVWPGLLHSILSLILVVLTGVMLFGVRRQDFSSIRLPLAPFFCIGGVTAYWLAAAAAVI